MERNDPPGTSRGGEDVTNEGGHYNSEEEVEQQAISYSRGRDKYDAYPEQLAAPSFEAFAEVVLSDRSTAKGLAWISASFKANSDGLNHRCRDGALPRRFLAFDLDGAAPDAFAELCMLLGAYSGFGYTTASHTAENPHARYMLELSRPVDRAEGIRLGAAMQWQIETRLGLGALKFDDSVYRGEQPIYGPLVNADVMYYGGNPIDVDAVLATAPEEPLRERPAPPDPYRARLFQLGMVLRELEPGKDAITCPFVGDHSPEDGASARTGSDTSTVYFWPLYGGCKWGRIHCLHGHRNERNKDQRLYLEKLGLDPKEVWRGQAGGAAPYEDDLPPVEVYVEDARRGNGKEGRGGNSDSSHHDKHGEAADATEGARAPRIEVWAGELPRIVSDAVDALQDAGAPIYVRGDALYRPVRIEAPPKDSDHVRRPIGAVVLRPVDPIWVRLQLASVAKWEKWNAKGKKMCPADPSKDVAQTVATQADLGNWDALRGVVSHPVVTLDGRVISVGGYDRDTGLLIEITGDWPIPEAPTRDDAIDAWRRLKELLRYFPWVSGVDRAVALSMLLTAVARPALPAAPMHCVDAPEAGTGKSLLVDVASILVSGAEAPVMDYGRDAVEAGKRLDAMLLAGDPIVAIDNVEAPIEGSALCQTLTQTVRRIRVLGLSKMVTVPCVPMVTANGNNLVLKGDVVRRAIICRMDAGTDRPELRDFDQDLKTEATEYRRKLVADIITTMLAYLRAGSPDIGVPPLGGYEPWSRMVRQALCWVGEADPCRSMERTRGDDPSRQNLASVLGAWHGAFGEAATTVAEAVTRAEGDGALREALAAVCEKRGKLENRALGLWLRDNKDKRSGRLVLRAGPPDGHTKVARWVVNAGNGGTCGECPSY